MEKQVYVGSVLMWLTLGPAGILGGQPELTLARDEIINGYYLKPTDPRFEFLGYTGNVNIRQVSSFNLQYSNSLETATTVFVENQGYEIECTGFEGRRALVDFIFDLPASPQSNTVIAQRGGQVIPNVYSLLLLYHSNFVIGDVVLDRGMVKAYYYERVIAQPADRQLSSEIETKSIKFTALNNLSTVPGQQLVTHWVTNINNPNQLYNLDGTPFESPELVFIPLFGPASPGGFSIFPASLFP